MKAVKQIRLKLGLSQDFMAVYLGIGRTTLAHAESGKIGLTFGVLQKLSKLEEAIANASVKAAREITNEPDTAGMIRNYEKRQMNCLFQVKVLQRKLAALEAQYDTANLLYKVLNELQHDDEDEKGWFKHVRMLAMRRMSSSMVPEREKIRNKIILLQHEATQIRNILRRNKSYEHLITIKKNNDELFNKRDHDHRGMRYPFATGSSGIGRPRFPENAAEQAIRDC